MVTDDNLPHSLVKQFIAGVPDTAGIASVELLLKLADALSNVIGEDGFESLLSRTLRRTSVAYPWLKLDLREPLRDPEFKLLREAFNGRDPAEARAASILLFTTLIDTLSLLIGAHLTTLILTTALASARACLREQGTAP